MKPLSRKCVKFPGKTDCHPESGYMNWWEDVGDIGPGKLKQELENEILEEILDMEEEKEEEKDEEEQNIS